MSHHNLGALVAQAIDAVCAGSDHPFDERAVALWVLQRPAVAAERGSLEYEEIEMSVRAEVLAQLRSKTDETGERVYRAGRAPNGRHIWYPMRLIQERANGDDVLLHKLVVALTRQDAEYEAGSAQ